MKKIMLFTWLIVSIYFCLGGIANIIINQKFEDSEKLPESKRFGSGGKEYRNGLEQEASEEYEKFIVVYPVYPVAGETMAFLVMLMSFGMLGSLIRILLIYSIRKTPLEEINVYTLPVLGGIVGLTTVILSEILPEFKDESGNNKVFFSLALLCGIYTEEFFVWLEQRIKTMLAEKTGPQQKSSTKAQQNVIPEKPKVSDVD